MIYLEKTEKERGFICCNMYELCELESERNTKLGKVMYPFIKTRQSIPDKF